MSRSKRLAAVSGLTAGRQHALFHLLQASHAALEMADTPAAFACRLSSLCNAGVTETDLRLLVAKGFVQHYLETTQPRHQRRTFRPATNQRFGDASCFVLTNAGVKLAEGLAAGDQPRLDPADGKANVPRYHGTRRTLSLNGHIIKQFKGPAQTQELILQCFQEEHWPAHLADPLPGRAGRDAKSRLNSAIRNLNANQKTPLLRFHGDGTGAGIFWEKLA